MKRLNFLIITVPAIVLISFISSTEILKSLGLTQERANSSIVVNIAEIDGFKPPYLKIAPEILTGDRAAAAREVCAYIKTYCESNDFAADYETYRQSKKPREEEIQQFDADQIQEMKEAAKTWDELSKDKTVPAAQRAEYKAQADDMKQLLARAEDPTPNLTEWKKNYPENPSVLIKKNLEEYLALAKTVDFSAQLMPPDEYNIRKFVNPAYEAKNLKWKAIYRGGKEVNTVATEFVKQWLAAGIKTGQPGLPAETSSMPESETGKAQESTTSSRTNNSSLKQESVNKAKGMVKSVKGKLLKVP